MRSFPFIPFWLFIFVGLAIGGPLCGVVHAVVEQRAGQADKLYHEGRELEGKGNFAGALAKFEAGLKAAEESKDTKATANNLLGIGSVHRALANYQKALEAFNRARKIGEELNDPSILGAALKGMGMVYFEQGRYPQALEYDQKALKIWEALGEKSGVAQVLTSLGVVYGNLGSYSEAITYFQGALKIWEELPDNKKGIARTLGNIGIVHWSQGSYGEAIAYLQRTLKIWEELGDKRGAANTFHNIAMVYGSQGLYETEIEYYRRALKIREELGDRRGIEQTLSNLGVVYWTQGSWAEAVEYYQKALKMGTELGDKSGVARTLNNLGLVYQHQGLPKEAAEYYRRALNLREELGEKRGIAETLGNLGGLTVTQGLYQEATEHYQRVLKIMEELGDKRWIAQTLNNLGTLYNRQGFYREALETSQRALKISREINSKSTLGLALINIGRIYLGRQEYSQAVEPLRQALALGKEIKEPKIIWQAARHLASGYEKLGRMNPALEHYHMAVAEIEKVRAKASSDEGKAGFLAQQVFLYEDLIRSLWKLERENPAAGYARQAFEYAERAKARVLLDLLQESKYGVRKKISSELLEKETSVLVKITNLQKRLIEHSEQGARKEMEGNIKKWEQELVEASIEHEQLKSEIRRRSPDYAALVYPEPIKFDQAQNLLDSKTALLEYTLGEETSYLFVITKEDFRVYPLKKKAELESEVEEFIKILGQGASADSGLALADDGYRLYRWLIEPAEAILHGKHSLIIVPDGNLALLPFAALLTGATEINGRVQFKSLPYLVKKYDLSFVPSASVLDSLRRRKRQEARGKRELVVFADPIYEEERKSQAAPLNRKNPTEDIATLRARSLSLYRGGLTLSRIEYSSVEAKKIAGVYRGNATVYLREDATEERVKAENLSAYRYVHFATHGIVNPDRPGFSAIALGTEGREDGFLQLPEIFNLDLDAELVTLSACQSGVGQHLQGEGLIGLARGFIYAGARSVLASLWRIEDSPATANFMETFYRKLKIQSKTTSLKATQLEFINSGPYDHPFYWAAFVLIGM
jgi:CHAT domain-containing protein/Tfp pilus assembly protein PilF